MSEKVKWVKPLELGKQLLSYIGRVENGIVCMLNVKNFLMEVTNIKAKIVMAPDTQYVTEYLVPLIPHIIWSGSHTIFLEIGMATQA